MDGERCQISVYTHQQNLYPQAFANQTKHPLGPCLHHHIRQAYFFVFFFLCKYGWWCGSRLTHTEPHDPVAPPPGKVRAAEICSNWETLIGDQGLLANCHQTFQVDEDLAPLRHHEASWGYEASRLQTPSSEQSMHWMAAIHHAKVRPIQDRSHEGPRSGECVRVRVRVRVCVCVCVCVRTHLHMLRSMYPGVMVCMTA